MILRGKSPRKKDLTHNLGVYDKEGNMDFTGFLTLLIIAVVVSAILHYGVKFYVTEGLWSFISKSVVGYVGALIAPTFFGNWGTSYGGVAVIPAILGSAALIILVVDVAKVLTGKSD